MDKISPVRSQSSGGLPEEAIAVWTLAFAGRRMHPPFAALYTRVSSHRQRFAYSLMSQLKAQLGYAIQRGFSVRLEQVYWEMYSGGKLWRPELSRLRADMRAHGFDAVVFHSVDRFARNSLHLDLVLDEAQQAGVQVWFVAGPSDEAVVDAAVCGMAGRVAELELESIRERLIRGRLERWRSGKPHGGGKAPYGMRYVDGPDPVRDKRCRLEPDPATAPVVRDIFRHVADGGSIRGICAALNRAGFAPPGAGQRMRTGRIRVWTNASINSILRNPAYTGQGWANRSREFMTADGKVHQEPRPKEEWIALPEGTYPRLVDDETWELAQQMKARIRLLYTRVSKTPEAFLLRGGFVRCGVCGWSMSTARWTRVGLPRYFCIGKAHGLEVPPDVRGSDTLPPVSIPSEPLDNAIWSHICKQLMRPGFLEEAIGALRHDAFEADLTGLALREARVNAELERLNSVIANLAEPHVSGLFTSRLDEIGRQLQQINIARRHTVKRAYDHEEALRQLMALSEHGGDLEAILASTSYEMKRSILRSLEVRIHVEPRRVRRSPEIPSFRVEACIPIEQPAPISRPATRKKPPECNVRVP